MFSIVLGVHQSIQMPQMQSGISSRHFRRARCAGQEHPPPTDGQHIMPQAQFMLYIYEITFFVHSDHLLSNGNTLSSFVILHKRDSGLGYRSWPTTDDTFGSGKGPLVLLFHSSPDIWD